MVAGFGLLCLRWIFVSVDITGFLLMLAMICTAVFRWRLTRIKWAKWSVVLDGVLCALFYPWALVLVMFSGMYYRVYFLAVLVFATLDIYIGMAAVLTGLCGAFLGLWDKEREQAFIWRDNEAERFYELEALQSDLMTATSKIEQMTIVSERARIAREIHDNAGHEIVAAYISLQTAREVMGANDDVLSLYDSALERLDRGVNRMREAVHNLAPLTMLGVEALQATCKHFPGANVDFLTFGDTAHVPVRVWSVLEPCLNEALTNAIRHAKPRKITVNLDTTPSIVRLCVENDGITSSKSQMGHGLRNLRHRVSAIGGSLAVDPGEMFRVTCVIPIKELDMSDKLY